jgi:DNA-binding NarL/FixJ family response regulator
VGSRPVPSIVAIPRAVFDNSWDTATPLSTPVTADESTSVTPGEEALLCLLAAGHTDESAAKRLGISVRTVGRQMNSLMIRLDASSRFQAGINAAQRGWLLAAGFQKGQLAQVTCIDAAGRDAVRGPFPG